MEFISALLIIAACVLIYKKLTAEKSDGNTHYPRWSPPAEPKDDLDDFKKGR